MTATVYLALLTRTARGDGQPIHLSLHTSEAGASDAVMRALTAEWDATLSSGLGPSSDWAEHRLLAEAERHGYTATVREQAVELDGAEERPGVLREAMAFPGDD